MFAPPPKKKINAVNIKDLEDKLMTLLKNGKAKRDNDTIRIDLSQMRFNKLLGSGKVTRKFEISVDSASKKAVEKIKKMGGKVNVNNNKSD